MTERRFDALHLQGPGTDLTIGLMPSSTWLGAKFTTADGLTTIRTSDRGDLHDTRPRAGRRPCLRDDAALGSTART